jgi:hypothetical protein
MALIFWGFAASYMIGFAGSMNANGQVAATSQIPLSPVAYIIALGLMAICLVILSQLVNNIYAVYTLIVPANIKEDKTTAQSPVILAGERVI